MCESKSRGGRRCASHLSQSAAAALIPRRGTLRGYYKATDAKHFLPLATQATPAAGTPASPATQATPGSTFTDPAMRRLNDVVALACRQRGNLDGDDREALVELGADWESFKPGVRYLMVRTPGTVGVLRSDDLPADTRVQVVRTKPGASCSLVLDVGKQPSTEVGTVIIGKNPDDDSQEIAFTAHPGLPTPVDGEDRMTPWEGRQVRLAQVREVYGADVWLNTRLVGLQVVGSR